MTNIWTYWETPQGKQKPAYLDICLETMERWKGDMDLHILDESTIRDYLPHLRTEVQHLSLNHRSDYYRSQLVHAYGGVWLDADVIALDPLERLTTYLNDEEVAFYGRGENNSSAGCFVGQQESTCLEAWIAGQDRLLDTGGEIPWNALGKTTLVEATRRHSHGTIPVEQVAPIPWQKWKWLLSRRRRPESYLEANPILFMLYNKFLAEALADFSRNELLESNMFISKIFRIALRDDE